MKKKLSFEWIVLALAAGILLLMAVRFVNEQTEQTVPWRVEVERNDRADASASVSQPEKPDSLLEGETVNLNTASLYDLERLPGVGSTRAQAIMDYRQEHGPFRSVDDLLQVNGIGPGTLEGLRAYVTAE